MTSREKLLLLHGFTGSHASWDYVFTEVEPARHTIDLYGHRGETEPLDFDHFEDAADALADELEALGGPFHLVAYSLGARVALYLLLARRHLFTRATLFGVQPGLSDERECETRLDADDSWACLLEDQGLEVFIDAWEAQPLLKPAAGVPKERIEHASRIRRKHTVEGLAWCMRTWGLGAMPDLWPLLRRIKVPVTLAVGAHDAKFRAIAEKMLVTMKNARLEIVSGAGHNVLLDRPETAAAIVRAQTQVSR